MYPGTHAQNTPEKPALIMGGSGEVVTYGELDERSNRLARLWYERGLRRGDHVAIFMENHQRYMEVVWAALRSGLYITPISSILGAGEVAYILEDSGARCLVTSAARLEVAAEAIAKAQRVEQLLVAGAPGALDTAGRLKGVGGAPTVAGDPVRNGEAGTEGGRAYWPAGRVASYEEALAASSAERLPEEPAGDIMLYSSGTTGRPKGVEHPLRPGAITDGSASALLLGGVFGFNASDVYLSPAPVYHSAPSRFCVGVQSLGGTIVMMEKFDPEQALTLISRYKVTTSQWVPTMFIRMLRLAEETRNDADVSSMRVAIHAAAPCPVEVKQRMMDWWGPVIWEYYAGTEVNGFCLVKPEEWLARPGTVGRPIIGTLHILDEAGEELPAGEPGTIYFADGMAYSYHNDPEKTQEAQDPLGHGWTTIGDMGYVDEGGWLFLTDRKAFMIISGGVNIYPQEVENLLATHPKVEDVAVIGVPNEEMGEEVKAVVQPVDWSEAGPVLAEELVAFCRKSLAGYKCPKSVDFERELPRSDAGKLYKRMVRDRYWKDHATRIA